MVSVCLPSDALLQHLPSYLGFSYLGRGVSLHGCSSKAQPLLLTLGEGYLLTTALPDLPYGLAPLGPPAPTQPRIFGLGVGPPLASGVGVWGSSSCPPPLASGLGHGVSPPGHRPGPRTRGNSSRCRPQPWKLGISSRPPPPAPDLVEDKCSKIIF